MALLTLNERFTIMDLVPKKAEYILLKQYRILKEKLSLKPEEIPQYEVKVDETGITYNKLLDKEKEVEFTSIELDIIRKELKILDEKRQLEDKHYSIYEKIINGG